MCLIVHKPAGRTLPAALLESAAEYNPHGAGMVALGPGGHPEVRRSAVTDLDEIRHWLEVHAAQECILHFRYRTRGEIDLENTHPLQVTDDIVLFHNGTLSLEMRTPGRSDTWHLARDYLAPALEHRPDLLGDQAFQRMVLAAIGPLNRVALVDLRRGLSVIFNREAGVEVDGIWLSNPRWFNPRSLGWRFTPSAPQTSRTLRFIG